MSFTYARLSAFRLRTCNRMCNLTSICATSTDRTLSMSCLTRTSPMEANDRGPIHGAVDVRTACSAAPPSSFSRQDVRGKKTKAGSVTSGYRNRLDQEDDHDDGFHSYQVDETDEGVGGKEVIVHVPSLRLDTLLKAGFVTSRSKMETAFYESRVRINGERVFKKSATVNMGDEVDVVIGFNDKSDLYLDVARIHVIAVRIPKEGGGRIANMAVKLRRYKTLTIENYEDKWTAGSSS